jgi:hypothetical protein
MADAEKVQGWIKTLWPLVVAIAVVLVTYTRTESKQEYLSQTFTAHVQRSHDFERKLHDCETKIMGIETDIKWIREGVSNTESLLGEAIKELRK